jgi:hypothetical protein
VLEVNTDTGEMKILGATEMTGYEITSEINSLNHVGWRAGNLDAQNFGPATVLSADFNRDNALNAADYIIWRKSLGLGNSGDANGDGNTEPQDYDAWMQQFGGSLAEGESWETLISTDEHLLESFLLGSSTFASQSIGFGYNTAIGDTNLAFSYTNADDQEFAGIVRYVSGAGLGSSTVPEPTTGTMLLVGMAATYFSRWLSGRM